MTWAESFLFFTELLLTRASCLSSYIYLDSLVTLLFPSQLIRAKRSLSAKHFLINVILLGLFGIQHSVMARQGFKRWWTKIVPRHIERTTYVLLSDLLVVLLLWQWRRMTGVIWDVEHPVGALVLWGLFGAGWLMIVICCLKQRHE